MDVHQISMNVRSRNMKAHCGYTDVHQIFMDVHFRYINGQSFFIDGGSCSDHQPHMEVERVVGAGVALCFIDVAQQPAETGEVCVLQTQLHLGPGLPPQSGLTERDVIELDDTAAGTGNELAAPGTRLVASSLNPGRSRKPGRKRRKQPRISALATAQRLHMECALRGRPPLGGRPRIVHRGSYSPAFNALTIPLPNPLA